jgi:CdiI immunity protein/Bacterial CdiA-CT RNAse A domain
LKAQPIELSPLQHLLLSGFHDGWEESWLDPGEGLECGLDSATRPGRYTTTAVTAELRELLTRNDERALARLMPNWGICSDLPEGGTYRRWLERVLARLEAGPAEPAVTAPAWARPPGGLAPLPRASRFLDEDTANTAATEVLRAHEPLVRRWDAGEIGLPRLHLYADLGRVIGRVQVRGVADKLDARAAVVTMARTEGKPYVATAYPELDLDESWREAFPDLPHLFGGHFGQDRDALDGTVWAAEESFGLHATPAARSRVADQLGRLLEAAPDDATARAAVQALGSYVLPEALRPWLARIHERLRSDVWDQPAG